MGAIISPCGQYRYTLTRELSKEPRIVVYIMLNPSTADAEQDDPTIRRCIGFAKALKCGRMIVLNLYAYRSPNPRDLSHVDDPVGPENDKYLSKIKTLGGKPLVIAAWGANNLHVERSRHVMGLLEGIPVHCLGLTDEGRPRHPLYLPAKSKLIPYKEVI